jgi:hypothetical protein
LGEIEKLLEKWLKEVIVDLFYEKTKPKVMFVKISKIFASKSV